MYKQSPKSPAMKALVGNQPNLPKGLRDAIEAEAPGKMMDSPAKQAPKNKKKAAAVEALRIKNQRRIMDGRIRSDWEKSTKGKSKAVAPITQQLPLERISNQNVGKQVLNERKAEMKKDGFSGSRVNLALYATNNQATAAELKKIKGGSKTFGEYADNVEKRFPNR